MAAKASPEPEPGSSSKEAKEHDAEEEEEDYMSMAIVEPTKPAEKETYTQRRIRKQHEASEAPLVLSPVHT